MLKTKDDIDKFCQDNINIKLPNDGPLWRIYMQEIEQDSKPMAIIIWKSHHSFCDGVSVMSLQLSMSAEYDRSYFVPSSNLTFIQKMLLRISVPLSLPHIIKTNFLNRHDNNKLTQKKG